MNRKESEFWNKIKQQAAINKSIEKTPLANKVLDFFLNKRLLVSNKKKVAKINKVKLKDCLFIAEKVEPRIYEVLPAAIIHYPKNITGLNQIPNDLEIVVSKMKKDLLEDSNDNNGPAFRGAPYENALRWAKLPIQDKRVKSYSEKRILKSYRFKKTTILKLEKLAGNAGITATEYLESLIFKE